MSYHDDAFSAIRRVSELRDTSKQNRRKMGKGSKRAKDSTSNSKDAKPKSKLRKSDEENDEQTRQEQSDELKAGAKLGAGDQETRDNDSSEDEESDDEEDDDLILEGVIVRNPDVSDSDDTSTSSEESNEEGDVSDDDKAKSTNDNGKASKKRPPSDSLSSENDDSHKKGASKKKKTANQIAQSNAVNSKKSQKARNKQDGPTPEIVQVDFTFCDMNEKYFHGLKTLLTSSSPVYASNSSALSDLMIKNVSVGTVVSTEGDTDGTVFGFASVLNVCTYQEQECIQVMKRLCLDKCPAERRAELEIVLSGKTKRPAGFFLQGRMVNMPLEVVEVLHQQLVLDMDWAVEHAEGGPDERKSLDFGAFVRIAPTYRIAGSTEKGYKYFEDEIMESHAEFSYDVELPKLHGIDETPRCCIIVMTKTGHRAAMTNMAQIVNG